MILTGHVHKFILRHYLIFVNIMRPYFPIILVTCLTVSTFAQSPKTARQATQTKPVVFSASSEWQKVTFKPTARLRPAQPASPAPVPERTTPAVSPAPSVAVGRTNPVVVPAPQTAPTPQPASAPVSRPTTTQPSLSSEPVSQPSAVAESVPVRRNPPSTPSATGYRPAFTGDFATNRNGWKAGNKGDYNYQIGLGKYNIRKRNGNTNQPAFSYVPLPSEINLNIAETFTIRVDVVADSGQIPTGGILFGVADSLNYSAFTLNGNGEISIMRVANGRTFTDYMPGDYFKPGVVLDKNRDRLTIRRNGEALHFYINDREVRSSPYPFKMLSGNGIGLTTTGYWTSFQKLSVTLGQ